VKYTEASFGRIFILRLEQGDKIPGTIEEFAMSNGIKSASVFFIGGSDKDSKVVVGPVDGMAKNPVTMVTELSGVSESLGIGTIFVNEDNIPKLHLHAAFGRNRETITGCTRQGVDIWLYGEVIIFELINNSAQRRFDHETGFELLNV
jgi:uncharacterized protein